MVITTSRAGVWTLSSDGWTYEGPVRLHVIYPTLWPPSAVPVGSVGGCTILNDSGTGPTNADIPVHIHTGPEFGPSSDIPPYVPEPIPKFPPVPYAESSRRRARADSGDADVETSSEHKRQCMWYDERDDCFLRQLSEMDAMLEADLARLFPPPESVPEPASDMQVDTSEPSCMEISPPPGSPIPVVELSSDTSEPEEDPDECPDEECADQESEEEVTSHFRGGSL